MHQHPRPSPAMASPALSDQTNPIRSNNARDRPLSAQASGSSEDFVSSRQEPDNTAAMQRLNQVVQNFHTKAALIILSSRAELSPAYSSKTNEKRVNKWFNIELDETDDYLDDIKRWKKIDIQVERPPPLIIEVYLTTDNLSHDHRLVILDDEQKRWDVYNALEPRDSERLASHRSERSREILLERWTIELGASRQPIPSDLAAILPHVYKKSIVLFRALFTYCNFLPAWKLIRKLGRSRSTIGMKVGFRIIDGDQLDSIPRADNLNTPLYEDPASVTTDYSFGSTDSPAGPFSVQVKYRSNCDFRVDDSEQLLSSKFIGADDNIFKPPNRQQREVAAQQVGSLPTDQRKNLMARPELGHAYGSLSTFHQAGISTGTSPISTLRAQKDLGSDSPSPQRAPPQQAQASRPAPSKTTSTSTAATTRRSSFNIQPFKAPSLAASPLGSSPLSASPRVSARVVPTLGSLEEEPHRDNRSVPIHRGATADQDPPTSTSSSPRPAPAQRFQSSFSHRRNRLSVDRTTAPSAVKPDDDQNSSGKASAASSAQPGSGLMTDGGREGSSGSLEADGENISDFLKMLDQKKDLLNPSSSTALENSARRTAAALNRFHKMRDSNAALSESMSSSLVVQRSSASSSRHAAQPGTSASTSPGGKPVSPHAPHTPFAPSRLSAAYSHDDPDLKESLQADGATSPGEPERESLAGYDVPGAINIPNSPLAFKPNFRRSSSAQRGRSDDDSVGLCGKKSASMGDKGMPFTEEPQPLELAGQREDAEADAKTRPTTQDGFVSDSGSARSSLPVPYVSRLRGNNARGGSLNSPTPGSLSSIGGTGASVDRAGDSVSASGSWRGGRLHGLTKPESKTDEDDENLPFLMDASTLTPASKGGNNIGISDR